jgi:stage V sporulation protein D (sporulation-specific penicillin-binding protein)
MIFQEEYYTEQAEDIQQRERTIKAARGEIYDTNGVILASNRTVCTVSVVYSQIKEPERVIKILTEILGIDEAQIRKKVEKPSSREVIQTNVDKAVGDQIRNENLEGVKVDEDYKRYYPYGNLASKVLGFTGGDNQGIIGLESVYEEVLKGTDGIILTSTDARGVELEGTSEERVEPIQGNSLYLTIDRTIQTYCQQVAEELMIEKSANKVNILAMNPQNGEILAMVNVPEFDLNNPFTLNDDTVDSETLSETQKTELLNQMWRNSCINDTYEPGSTFKIITMSAGLDAGVVSESDTFSCPGYRIVEDRRIKCHKTTGHGSETFVEGAMNSCNPVFMEVGARIGASRFYDYFTQFGLLEKTGIDLPGEASTIMHQRDNIGEVELATISFGQSFQLTPLRLLTTVCSLINGGKKVIPHLAKEVRSADGQSVEVLQYETNETVLSESISKRVCSILEKVVSEGTGKNAAVEGYTIGGKTATSEKLPRGTGKYISSFLGFSSTENPTIALLITVDEPEGVYYGGTVCAPKAAKIFQNVLPYLQEKD